MTAKEIAFNKIVELIEKYSSQAANYENPDYNESQTRCDFVDPFFEALGWDVGNKQGYSESNREVIHEDKLRIGQTIKAPDYAFRLGGGNRLFFVEAKKPSVPIKESAEPADQLRRYGWNSKLAVSIVTNFKEFAVYDCTRKPSPSDKVSTGRLVYLTYLDYVQDKNNPQFSNGFNFIWNTFGKENVLKGGLEKFIKSDTYKKGASTVDQDFLQLMDDWRTILAASISRNNKQLAEDELNFVVQQTLDRIIFIRIAEDRGIEPQNSLKLATETGNYYANLFKRFLRADEKYNSGLFNFDKDKISATVIIDNHVIKTIVRDLYYPSPYNFSVIPVEILGSVYEQFLGKVIYLTSGGRVKIEPKPEVRKSGGVFYTPQYIVQYIVQKTVGKLVEGKTPKEVSRIKIVDPACGSGSFLLGAYQYLLDWHQDYYLKHAKPSKGHKNDPLTPMGMLSTSEKKRILLNNIFGVDIDVNAVEVTKLSLLIKCMEGETEASVETIQRLFHEQVLPSIDDNIRDGNSLIDTDFYDNNFDFGDEKKIKPFNWKHAFPEIFKQNGFDCVIGNPPWGADLKVDKSYLKLRYKNRSPDSAAYFLELANRLSKQCWGMIVPKTICYYAAWNSIRELLIQNNRPANVLDVGKAFSQVNLESVVLIFDKDKKTVSPEIAQAVPLKLPHHSKEIVTLGHFDRSVTAISKTIPMIGLSAPQKNLILKLYKNSVKLGDVADDIFRGLYISDAEKESIRKGKTKWINKVPDVKRWFLNKINFITIPSKYQVKAEKIMTPRVFLKVLRGSRLVAFPDPSGEYLTTEKLVNITINRGKYSCDYRFLCAALNVPITSFYLQKVLFSDTTETARVMDRIYSQYIILPPLDMQHKPTKKNHDDIVKLVDQLLKLNAEKSETKLPSKINQLNEKITYCEDKINQIVYQLYGLTKEEIAVAEEAGGEQ
ncbi:MAG: N-6 DNA methylase [Planctomycetaceae bacterium]|jgi:type I restriction-modification system DNA methylase subunit|nr:N-6 DNA methylase [Planctomycetaceae bacterium]